MNLDDLLDVGANKTSGLVVTPEVKGFLHEAGKWARILGIFGFIMIGLMVVSMLFMIGTLSMAGGQALGFGLFMIVFYIFFAGLYVYPVLKLYQFGTNIKRAVESEDQESMRVAFQALSSHYKFIGIFTIVIFGLYLIFILATMLIGFSAFSAF